MNLKTLKRIGNATFIVSTLTIAGWAVVSPRGVPTLVIVFTAALCVAFLIMTFWSLLHRRSR
ncbi:hypothetical protein ACWEU6_12785 [Streptosporangium sandarakinum]|uniref:hypothetical protein n=1 Tax=Streptosporangium sandarakinum TaxID=1260955 RepID=UPI0036ABB73E